ncbi:repeat-containing protein [Lutibacter oricola]|uniref:Repeat-containing protein n=1 Tax=Lutibacter oricola TaxID=762486 RepID=A0A1H3FJU2_9FLAO|nr:SwmB domain-containing protein [Lutibacter oricola]SDX90379.1 repeat-containing protein [Lutibacter oricola]
MKKLKYIIKTIFSLSLLALIMVGCDDDDYDTPPSFSDLSFTFTTGASTDKVSEVNRYYSFMDLSAGAQERYWTIPSENAFFLEGPVPNNLDNHDEYIVNPGTYISTDQTIHVLWKKGDSLSKVKYYGTFLDSTSFIFPNDYVDGDTVNDTIRTVKVGDKWVADYTFIIDVYDTVVAVPQVRYMDETILDHKNVDAVTLTFGDKLIFEDLSGLQPDNIGRPETTKWRVHTTEVDSTNQKNIYNKTLTRVELLDRVIDTITFDEIGDYQVELKATRERTERLKLSTDIYDIPTVFTVLPLDVPLTQVGDIIESNADEIMVSLSHKIQTYTENVSGNFVVEIDGVASAIESVNRNSNGTKLIITLETPLVPADASKTITVSYDGTNAALWSFDERLLEAFDNIPVEVYVPTPVEQQGDAIELEDQTIKIGFDTELDSNSFTDPITGFEVLVNGTPFAVASVSLDATDPKMLNITMAEQIYRTDVITISNDGTGSIYGLGDGAITPYTNVPVTMFEGNMIVDSSFEGTFGDVWVEGASGSGAVVEFSTEQAYDGSQSAKLEDSKPRLETSNGVLNYEAGVTYLITYRRYITSGSDISSTAADKIWYDLSKSVAPKWGASPAVDTWELVKVEVTPTADSMGKNLRLQPIPTSGVDFVVYYDDFRIFKNDARP